jgi:hypothetical protein
VARQVPLVAPWLAVFFGVHAVLGVVMKQSPAAATAHAVLVLGAGMLVAATGRARYAVELAAYIAGSEVLWRMTSAAIPYESAKYAVAAILLLAGLRERFRAPNRYLPVLYFLLLVPSAFLTLARLGMTEGRIQVAFNLLGPFALMASTWYFWRRPIPAERLPRLLLAAVGPVVGVAAVAVYSTLTAGTIRFSGESNFVTSGGFGPNQVSTILGLGLLLGFLYLISVRTRSDRKLVVLAAMLVFLGQGLLTFSRGGMLTAAGGIAVGSLFLLRDRRSRIQLVLVAAMLFGALQYGIMPALDSFTRGALSQRFGDTDTSHRGELAAADLLIWSEHPLLGVGPGMAKFERAGFEGFAAHTEYSRMLSEHGTLGLLALVLLLVMAGMRLRMSEPPAGKAIAAALLAWALVTGMHAAMRTVAPGFAFGLGTALCFSAPGAAAVARKPVMRWKAGYLQPAE